MFKELDTVVLTHNIDKYGLEKGDIGTIVHTYGDEKAIEVLINKKYKGSAPSGASTGIGGGHFE